MGAHVAIYIVPVSLARYILNQPRPDFATQLSPKFVLTETGSVHDEFIGVFGRRNNFTLPRALTTSAIRDTPGCPHILGPHKKCKIYHVNSNLLCAASSVFLILRLSKQPENGVNLGNDSAPNRCVARNSGSGAIKCWVNDIGRLQIP